MRIATLVLALLIPTLAACTVQTRSDEKGEKSKIHISIFGQDTKGDGQLKTETRTVTAFNTLESTGMVDTELVIGDTPSLIVEADSNLIPMIKTVQNGDVLKVYTEGSFSTQQPIRIKVVTPALTTLRSVGSGDISISNLKDGPLDVQHTGSGEVSLNGKLAKLNIHSVGSGDIDAKALQVAEVGVEIMGSGEVNFGALQTNTFDAAVHGSGQVSATGTSGKVKVSVMGSGDVDMGQMEADNADLSVMGSGDVSLKVKNEVTATTRGSGSIMIHGNPPKRTVHGDNVEFQ